MLSSGNLPEIVAAVVVGVLSVARTARLLTHDTLPPVEKLRSWLSARLAESDWEELIHCPFCVAPYLAAGMGVWWWLADGHWTWWVINGWWAASYVAAIVVAYDQPE